ncbi:proline racemase family protein [Frateuria aurantia]
MHSIDYIDSHTAGEPTRVILAGLPSLGDGALSLRLQRFREQFDHWRSAVACEPRGSDTMVGALLLTPVDPSCCTGVIFFNNVGYLGMCGHGTMGVVRTLAHLGRIGPGVHRIETPVGVVEAELLADGRIRIANVRSYRLGRAEVEVPGHGRVSGDIAWGGNWFFISSDTPRPLEYRYWRELTDYTAAIRDALEAAGITGADGAEIDHIELSTPLAEGRGARNFVLCPGLAYDRSPCGTGTSAKLACLAADGKLQPGEVWLQEGVLGTAFQASYRADGEGVLPTLVGQAYITAIGQLLLDDAYDPFAWGIRLA